MNECVWILLGFIAFVAIVLYVIYLCNLHSRVSRLEYRASPRLEIIEREVHGIGCYMRIIVGLAIFFCVCTCVHYLSYCYPRYIPPKQTGFDYMGVVVGIMGVMITLLVGWQIFSSIKEKERIDKLSEDFKDYKNTIQTEYGNDIAKMSSCCAKRGKDISNIETKLKELDKRISFIIRLNNKNQMPLNIKENFELLDLLQKDSNNTNSERIHAMYYVISSLHETIKSGEYEACSAEAFKRYYSIAKKTGDESLIEYVKGFLIFDENSGKRLTPSEKEKLFDEA